LCQAAGPPAWFALTRERAGAPGFRTVKVSDMPSGSSTRAWMNRSGAAPVIRPTIAARISVSASL
jgi:hypothetical protein